MASWEGVNEFVSVAQTNSFTGAAKKLSTSVAQVSRRVSALEQHLGVVLLYRTTRRVSLTEAGQVYYQQCKHVVEGLDLAELAVSEMQSSPKGLLKITAPVTYGEQHIAPLLHQFLGQYPAVNLELVLTNQKLDLIESGIDIAVRLGRLDDSRFVAKKLSTRQLHVCASPAYIKRHGEPYTLSELSHHQCLMGSIDYWRFTEDETERSIRVNGRVKSNSGLALRDAAKRGLGLVQLPDYYVHEDLAAGHLIEVLTHYRCEREGVWALYLQNRHLSPKVRLLIDFLSEALSS
ncbi:LysR family transcriptional regulator [Echinimonas agarilytica]|uniref:LysR family transcriptional regulator n=1 Tax=Echinimonas agarilytica TaxID=1215918 RepID=A0AA41WAF3_9GAMM|nr:LysR family transcriptional regulator [Echinimonas agarilytica]